MSFAVEKILSQREAIESEIQRHKSPVTLLFTALEDSTPHFDRFGEAATVEWMRIQSQLVMSSIREYDGTVVKAIGDFVVGYFTDVRGAVASAQDILRKLHESNQTETEESGTFLRVALHQGLGYLKGGDVFGDMISVTARVTKLCLPMQILTTESVYRAVRDGMDVNFNPMGTQHIRGMVGTESLYEIGWTDTETYAQLRQQFPPRSSQLQEELSEGRYQILAELGHGAMGVVYKAYDRVIGRVVAMKTIPLEITGEERDELVARLKQEARAAGVLDHPNLITAFDFGEISGLFYLTMQFVEGETFASMLARKELMPLEDVLTALDQICSGVGFAHKAGIIHRDLKPANIMWTKQGSVKVLDFGIAKLADSGLTQAGTIIGTPSYLSPEQACGRRIDSRSDIFALGAVFYELLTGDRAFPGESATGIIYKVLNEDPIPLIKIEPTLPPGLDAAIRKALAKDPNQRFQTCEEMRQAIAKCRTETVDVPTRVMPAPKATLQTLQMLIEDEPEEKSRKGWLVAAAAVLVAVGIAAFVPQVRQGVVNLVQKQQPAHASEPVEQPAAPATNPVSAESPQLVTQAPVTSEAAVTETTPAAEESKPVIKEVSKKAKEKKPAKAAEKEKEAVQEEESPAEPVAGGFYRSDIPALMSKADRYAGQGEYDKAIFLYRQILKIDPKNPSAREGLQRAQEAQSSKR